MCVCVKERDREREKHLLHVIYLTISVLCSAAVKEGFSLRYSSISKLKHFFSFSSVKEEKNNLLVMFPFDIYTMWP